MSDLNALVKELQEKINKQNNIISQLKAQSVDNADASKILEEKEKEIASLKSTISNLNAKIEDFTKQQEFDVMVKQIKDKELEIDTLSTQLAEKDKIIAEKQQKINEIEAQIPACQELIQDLQQQLAARMQSPTSTPSYSTSPDVEEGYYPKPSMVTSSTSPSQHVSGSFGAPGEMDRQCPNCGAMGFAIKEVEDRSKILSYTPKVYGKKRVCSKCSYEF